MLIIIKIIFLKLNLYTNLINSNMSKNRFYYMNNELIKLFHYLPFFHIINAFCQLKLLVINVTTITYHIFLMTIKEWLDNSDSYFL